LFKTVRSVDLTKGTEIQLTIANKKQKYHIKIFEKNRELFYEKTAFGGLIKSQLNPDGALYIMKINSNCPEKESPNQPRGFPAYNIKSNTSNEKDRLLEDPLIELNVIKNIF